MKLVQVVQNGFDAYPAEYSGSLDLHSKRTRASLIHDHMVRQALDILPQPDFQLVPVGQRNLFNFREKFLIQFKKLNANLTTSNYPTRQAWLLEEYGTAEGLPGILAELPIVTVGYVPRDFFAAIEGIFATQSVGHTPGWVHRLDDGGEATPSAIISLLPAHDPDKPKSRIRRPNTGNSSGVGSA